MASDAPRVAPARAGDAGAVAVVLAHAFRDNPLNRAVVPGGPEARLRANLHGMRTQLPGARRRGVLWVAHASAAAGGVLGALVAAPPLTFPFPLPDWAAQLRCLWGQGFRVARRWALVAERLQAEHPLDSHWYLATLGVAPSAQGRGLGRALLERWLAQVDADGARAYLETDALRNVGFYERSGFGVTREIRLLGVPVWLMARPGRSEGA